MSQNQNKAPFSQRCSEALVFFHKYLGSNPKVWTKDFYQNASVVPDHPLITNPSTEVVFKVAIPATVSNFYGAMHGGSVASMIDDFTTVAISASDEPGIFSVSVKLDVDYIRSVAAGGVAYLLVNVNKMGRKICFTGCKVFDEKLKLCYVASHTKMRMKMNL